MTQRGVPDQPDMDVAYGSGQSYPYTPQRSLLHKHSMHACTSHNTTPPLLPHLHIPPHVNVLQALVALVHHKVADVAHVQGLLVGKLQQRDRNSDKAQVRAAEKEALRMAWQQDETKKNKREGPGRSRKAGSNTSKAGSRERDGGSAERERRAW
jgi:hypothetical protein